MNRRACTIAEALIGCVIIGLMAWLLIPHLVKKHQPGTPAFGNWSVESFAGCEYVIFCVNGECHLVHKGNCTNVVHYRQPENP